MRIKAQPTQLSISQYTPTVNLASFSKRNGPEKAKQLFGWAWNFSETIKKWSHTQYILQSTSAWSCHSLPGHETSSWGVCCLLLDYSATLTQGITCHSPGPSIVLNQILKSHKHCPDSSTSCTLFEEWLCLPILLMEDHPQIQGEFAVLLIYTMQIRDKQGRKTYAATNGSKLQLAGHTLLRLVISHPSIESQRRHVLGTNENGAHNFITQRRNLVRRIPAVKHNKCWSEQSINTTGRQPTDYTYDHQAEEKFEGTACWDCPPTGCKRDACSKNAFSTIHAALRTDFQRCQAATANCVL